MTYSLRTMHLEDVAQVTDIDREAFPTQLPPANYRQELQNRLARYIVSCDETKTVEETSASPERGLFKLLPRIKWWSDRNRLAANELPAITRQLIVGFAGIWVLADEAHITNIAVRTQYQRRGLGELMLLSLVDLANELKVNILTLEVRASNITAQNLYYKCGFVQVGLRRGYYLDNREDGILMSTENINSESFQAQFQRLKHTLSQKWGSQPPVIRKHQAQPDMK